MIINKSKLNPLYDQYSNAENRLTHALLHTVSSSNWLFSRFLRDLFNVNIPAVRSEFEISTQKVPSGRGDLDPEQVQSVPDAWIIEKQSKLGIAIEVKAEEGKLRRDQLLGHVRRIRNFGYQYLFVITAHHEKPKEMVELERSNEGRKLRVEWRSWDQVYVWLAKLRTEKTRKREPESFLVDSMREYMLPQLPSPKPCSMPISGVSILSTIRLWSSMGGTVITEQRRNG